MPVIKAKFMPPTNTLPARVKLSTELGPAVTLPYDYAAPMHEGVTRETVMAFARECFPLAGESLEKTFSGPHGLKPGVSVYTFEA